MESQPVDLIVMAVPLDPAIDNAMERERADGILRPGRRHALEVAEMGANPGEAGHGRVGHSLRAAEMDVWHAILVLVARGMRSGWVEESHVRVAVVLICAPASYPKRIPRDA